MYITVPPFPLFPQMQRNVEQAQLVEVLQRRLQSREQDLKMLQELISERDRLRRRSMTSGSLQGIVAAAVGAASAGPGAAPRPLDDTMLGLEIDSYFQAAAGSPKRVGGSAPGPSVDTSAGDISVEEIAMALRGEASPPGARPGSAVHASATAAAGPGPGLGASAPGATAGHEDARLRSLLVSQQSECGHEGAAYHVPRCSCNGIETMNRGVLIVLYAWSDVSASALRWCRG